MAFYILAQLTDYRLGLHFSNLKCFFLDVDVQHTALSSVLSFVFVASIEVYCRGRVDRDWKMQCVSYRPQRKGKSCTILKSTLYGDGSTLGNHCAFYISLIVIFNTFK